jgi:hypothetical protein
MTTIHPFGKYATLAVKPRFRVYDISYNDFKNSLTIHEAIIQS